MLTRGFTGELGVFVSVSKDVSSPTISLCFAFICTLCHTLFHTLFHTLPGRSQQAQWRGVHSVCVFCECAVVVSFIPCFIPCFIPPVSYPCAHPCFRVPVSRKRGQKTHPYEHCRSVNTSDLKKVGTSVCECALFVNWVVLGDLSADPGILVAVFSLDTQGRRSRRPHRYRARFRFCF